MRRITVNACQCANNSMISISYHRVTQSKSKCLSVYTYKHHLNHLLLGYEHNSKCLSVYTYKHHLNHLLLGYEHNSKCLSVYTYKHCWGMNIKENAYFEVLDFSCSFLKMSENSTIQRLYQ